MRIAILQPSFFPWLGYFDQMARVDRFVYLDDVQYTRRDWRNRNKIRTAQGWMWLTVPVVSRGHFGQALKETRIDNSVAWKGKHLKALLHNYRRTPYFDLHFPGLESIYNKEWFFLLDLCLETLTFLRRALGITTLTCLGSSFQVQSAKQDKILQLCRSLEADRYLSGDVAENYLDVATFNKNGINVEFQNYHHPEYPQAYPGFAPYLSVVDLLFNQGCRSLDTLRMPETAVLSPAGEGDAG
ncbi:MAG: WbqC family protein [Nitrospinaceae bacterium]